MNIFKWLFGNHSEIAEVKQAVVCPAATVPLSASRPNPVAAPPKPIAIRVIVCDDDREPMENVASLLKKPFGGYSFVVETYLTAEQALEQVESASSDEMILVVTDMGFNYCDDALAWIKKKFGKDYGYMQGEELMMKLLNEHPSVAILPHSTVPKGARGVWCCKACDFARRKEEICEEKILAALKAVGI